jgi:hypothetical protein
MDQDPLYYWATSSVRYRSSGPYGGIIFKYSDAPDTNLTLGPYPDHPAWDDMEPTLELEANLATKDIDFYPDADVLTADEASIRRVVIVGTQATDLVTGKLRWAVNNVTYDMPSKPFILSAYEAVNADGADPWPDTVVPGAIVLPESPPNPWNYSDPVHDNVGTYNGESGPSMIPVTGKYIFLRCIAFCFSMTHALTTFFIYTFLLEGEIVEIIMQNARALNNVTEMHPWHLHGYSFYVIGMGDGIFDEDVDVSTYNLENPIRRDTFTLLPGGWTAIRFRANNVGVWPFHCTIPPHLVMGMEVLLVVSPDQLDSPPPGSRSCGETSLASDEGSSSTSNVFVSDDGEVQNVEEGVSTTDESASNNNADAEESYGSVESDDMTPGSSAVVSVISVYVLFSYLYVIPFIIQ